MEDNDAGRETNRSICASRFTILSHPDITEKVVIVETQSKTKATRLLGSMIVRRQYLQISQIVSYISSFAKCFKRR